MDEEGELTGQARRGVERRQAIVAAAIEAFAAGGFRATSLKDVADRVGVTAANLLYHFGSKEGLLVAVIAERDRRGGEDLAQMHHGRGIEAIRDGVRFAQQSEEERGLAALHTVLQVESFDPEAPAHEYFLARSRQLRLVTQRRLEEGQHRGEVRADLDCRAKADEVVAFLEGAAVLWLLDPEQVSLVELYTSYLESFIEAIAASAVEQRDAEPGPGAGRTGP